MPCRAAEARSVAVDPCRKCCRTNRSPSEYREWRLQQPAAQQGTDDVIVPRLEHRHFQTDAILRPVPMLDSILRGVNVD